MHKPRPDKSSVDRFGKGPSPSSSEISSANSWTASKIVSDRELKDDKNKNKNENDSSTNSKGDKGNTADKDNMKDSSTNKTKIKNDKSNKNDNKNNVGDGDSKVNDITSDRNVKNKDNDKEFDFEDDSYAREHHAFGEVQLSVTRIPPPPPMEVTVNRRSGTPAEAAARPAAAVAAKAAAESDNVREEWVDGDPVETHHSRARMPSKPPSAPSDLTGFTGEMRLVEMACLTGLSSRAGKSAGLIMHEQLGFGHLLRGLRDDVRPSLQRRVLQAVTTLVDSDPSLAPYLLGHEPHHDYDDDDADFNLPVDANGSKQSTNLKTSVKSGTTTAASAAAVTPSNRSKLTNSTGGMIGSGVGRRLRGAARRRRRRRRRVGDAGSEAAAVIADLTSGPDDVLIDHITAILGYHSCGGAGGVGGVAGSSCPGDDGGRGRREGVGPFERVVRGVVASNSGRNSSSDSSHSDERKETDAEAEAAKEGRDWWKDEVALEEEGLEQQAATLAGGGGWGSWWGRGKVSRQRLVEEALELTFRLVMSGDTAVELLKVDKPLVAALRRVAEGGQRLQYDAKGILRRVGPPLSPSQLLANKILAALGAHKWVPKTQGQKGIRILCFDGGGTRGVLTLALLKHVEAVFDMIVGTSTGGIIAGLAGVKALPVSKCESMYDNLINKIFIKHPGGGMKLALTQAFYDEVGWMNILSSILGDQLMVESAQDPLRPLILCPSTIISSNPAKVMLWRNYNYPSGHQSRYYGSFRHMVREAIRATTAAPTFFAPLMINGALYSDGALLCNNPSAVALHEHVFPGVPIEMIVSLGTGCFFEEKKEFAEPTLGWDGIINQVSGRATETEITTDIVSDLLPPEQFFRFNPRMYDMPIDEVRKERLDWLKTLAGEYFEEPENQARLQEMAERMLPPS
eukprot:jgi/Undpi1/11928/HiC_scaffold_4.g01627.m1